MGGLGQEQGADRVIELTARAQPPDDIGDRDAAHPGQRDGALVLGGDAAVDAYRVHRNSAVPAPSRRRRNSRCLTSPSWPSGAGTPVPSLTVWVASPKETACSQMLLIPGNRAGNVTCAFSQYS